MPSKHPLRIVEIVRRLEQGATRPFLVRTEDDVLYVAKGRNLPPRERMAEWLAASLTLEVGLPIPEFALLDVPQELIDLLGSGGAALGAGLVFGSRWQANAQEFSVSDLVDWQCGPQPDPARRQPQHAVGACRKACGADRSQFGI